MLPVVEPGDNVGWRLDNMTVVDCDSPEAVAWWEQNGIETPYVSEGAPGHRVYWYAGEAFEPGVYHWYLAGERCGEVRVGHVAYNVVPPSIHPSGKPYRWVGETPVSEWDMPTVTAEQLPRCNGRRNIETADGWVTVQGSGVMPDKVRRLPNERCPGSGHSNGDASPSLGIVELADGRMWPGCFSGCDETEVIEALVAEGRYARDSLWPPEALDGEGWGQGTGHTDEISDVELAALHLPPVRWVIADVLPEGLTILGGKPKVGKSWLALDMGLSVAMGRDVAGCHTEQGDVLYLALEDNLRRVQWRSKQVRGTDAPAERLRYRVMAPRLGAGLEELVAGWLDRYEEARLIIVDTLGMVRPVSNGGDDGDGGYREAYEALGRFKRESDKRGVAIVVVHHVRKAGAEDPLDTLAGSVGLAGAADTILVLKKTENGGTLVGRGRDLAEVDLDMEFDEETFRWNACDTEEVRQRRAEARAKRMEQKVTQMLDQGATWTEVSRSLKQDQRDVAKLLYQSLGGTVGKGNPGSGRPVGR